MSGNNKPNNNKSKKPEPGQERAGLIARLLIDDQLRNTIWIGATIFLALYLGAMIIFRFLLLGGEGSRYDSTLTAVTALITAVVAGRKCYNDDT